MKKFILILFAAVAMVACRQNRPSPLSMDLNPSPSRVTCTSDGTNFTINTAVASYFAGATIWEEPTDENPTGEASPLYYTIKQLDATTYDITIKPYTGQKVMYLRFGIGADSNAGVVAVSCQQ